LKKAILIDDKDNVATVTSRVEASESLKIIDSEGAEFRVLFALEAIPFGHKIAVLALPKRGKVVKYGEIIGEASADIKAGNWVHIHNLVSRMRREGSTNE